MPVEERLDLFHPAEDGDVRVEVDDLVCTPLEDMLEHDALDRGAQLDALVHEHPRSEMRDGEVLEPDYRVDRLAREIERNAGRRFVHETQTEGPVRVMRA